MRSRFRSIAASALLAVVALASAASGALAGNATPTRYAFDDAWCFDDVVAQYCFEQHYTVQVLEFADGDGWVRIAGEFKQVAMQDGVVVSTSREVSKSRSVYVDGGQVATQEVVHVRYASDDLTCVSTRLLKITDYELKFDRVNGPACS